MRLIMLDTETTGLRVEEGHRVIEIGAIECMDRRVTARHFHVYLNPEREVDEGAAQVHGMTWDMLKDKPLFGDVVKDFLAFVEGARVVIHNAEFDRGFLDAELSRAGLKPFAQYVESIVDSLGHARDLHPGQRNSLDALCQRYAIVNEHRVLHGALLDARLLADVYLAMTRGQDSLAIGEEDDSAHAPLSSLADVSRLVVRRADDAENAAHEAILDGIAKASKTGVVWRLNAENAASAKV